MRRRSLLVSSSGFIGLSGCTSILSRSERDGENGEKFDESDLPVCGNVIEIESELDIVPEMNLSENILIYDADIDTYAISGKLEGPDMTITDEINIELYDKSGQVISEVEDGVYGLDQNETYSFFIPIDGGVNEPSSYKISIDGATDAGHSHISGVRETSSKWGKIGKFSGESIFGCEMNINNISREDTFYVCLNVYNRDILVYSERKSIVNPDVGKKFTTYFTYRGCEFVQSTDTDVSFTAPDRG